MKRQTILLLTVLPFVASVFITATGCQTRRASDSGASAFISGDSTNKPKDTATPPHPDCSLPRPQSFVSDLANVVDKETRGELERKLGRLKKIGEIDFAVVTTKTIGGQQIFDYSLTLARCWGVGASNPDKAGVLLLVAVDDRKWQIQVSRELEQVLPNDELSEWGRLMTGPFRAGRYGEGIVKCVDAIIKALEERRGFSVSEA